MSLPKDKAWFPAKTYGWGWGLPRRWQGWAVLGGFIIGMIAGSLLVEKHPIAYVCYVGILATILIAICYAKGEAPGWRWGDRE